MADTSAFKIYGELGFVVNQAELNKTLGTVQKTVNSSVSKMRGFASLGNAKLGASANSAMGNVGNLPRTFANLTSSIRAATREIDAMGSACYNMVKQARLGIGTASRAVSAGVTGGSHGGAIERGLYALPGASIIASALARPFSAAFSNFMGRESLSVNLGTLLGDDARGAAFQQRLQAYATETPYGQSDLAGTAQTLLQYGVNESDAEKYIRQLGDIAMGDRNRFQSLGLALGQIQSTGRLQGQDLLQMINAGFNPLSIIAEETGRSMAELKDAMSRGEIGFDQVAMALQRATEQGGQFYKGAERGSKTFQGLISTIQDNFATALGDAVNNNQGAFRQILESWAAFNWTAFTEGLTRIFSIISDGLLFASNIVSTLGEYKGVINTIVSGLTGLGAALGAMAVVNFIPMIKSMFGMVNVLNQIPPAMDRASGSFARGMNAISAGISAHISKIGAISAGFMAGTGQQTTGGVVGGMFSGAATGAMLGGAQGALLGVGASALGSLYSGVSGLWNAKADERAQRKQNQELNNALDVVINARKQFGADEISESEYKTIYNTYNKIAKEAGRGGLQGSHFDIWQKEQAQAKDAASTIITTNNNITQNNNISSDFNDIGKLVRENLTEILRSQLNFTRDKEQVMGLT